MRERKWRRVTVLRMDESTVRSESSPIETQADNLSINPRWYCVAPDLLSTSSQTTFNKGARRVELSSGAVHAPHNEDSSQHILLRMF